MSDIEALNRFHRRLLRKTCNIRWPNTISSVKLYRLTKRLPIIVAITKARWQYFGHALRMNMDSPPQVAMNYYFLPEPVTKFPGTKRATIVTTLQRDINTTKHKFPHFQIKSLNSMQDLEHVRNLASDRTCWRRITKTITDVVQAKSLKQDTL